MTDVLLLLLHLNFMIVDKSLVSSSMRLYTCTFDLPALCLPFLVFFPLSSA